MEMTTKGDTYTVEQVRLLSGLSQETMAKRLNMSKNSYINKEKGVTRFYVDEALKLENVSGIPLKKIRF